MFALKPLAGRVDELTGELAGVRVEYNAVRLHAGIGYRTPDDEHRGRSDHLRRQRRTGLAAARTVGLQHRRSSTKETQ